MLPTFTYLSPLAATTRFLTIARGRMAAMNSSAKSNLQSPRLSAVLRDQLLRDIGNLNSAESAAVWARRILPAKKTLHEADARQLEEAFQAKLTVINDQSNSASGSNHHDESQAQHTNGDAVPATSAPVGHALEVIDKSEFAHPEPRRIRDRDHLRFVASQPCLICGRTPADPHHLRFAQHRALGRKVSDEWVVALCRGHHREVHRHGDERDWWEKAGIDPNVTARTLWLQSHPSRLR